MNTKPSIELSYKERFKAGIIDGVRVPVLFKSGDTIRRYDITIEGDDVDRLASTATEVRIGVGDSIATIDKTVNRNTVNKTSSQSALNATVNRNTVSTTSRTGLLDATVKLQ